MFNCLGKRVQRVLGLSVFSASPRVSRTLLSALFVFLLTGVVTRADAHFIWVYAEDGKVKVVFGEGLEPDQAQFLGRLSGMKAYTVRGERYSNLKLDKRLDGEQGWFETSLERADTAVDLSCQYGVFGRGDKSMFLNYSAKYIPLADNSTRKASAKLMFDIVPQMRDGKLNLTAYFQGKPVKGVEIVAYQLETDVVESVTSDQGSVTIAPATRYLIRAKHVDAVAGEFEGQKYDEKRYYCTLVLDIHGGRSDDAASHGAHHDSSKPEDFTVEKINAQLADLPLGITSFGGGQR